MARHHDRVNESLNHPFTRTLYDMGSSRFTTIASSSAFPNGEPIDIFKPWEGDLTTPETQGTITNKNVVTMPNPMNATDVEVSTEDLGGIGGGLDGGNVVIIEDITPEQSLINIRGSARYVSLCAAIDEVMNDPSKEALDDLASTIAKLIQDERSYKGKETHQLIMATKLKGLFDLMSK